ncbi:glucokinase [Leptolyngbyaceae cyanobacterium JSC-12]|nr:glucokinase [Leptolyngbyaceae cyanobacterium JSC-12]
MTVLLAGDIGGTKTILRLVRADISEIGQLPRLTSLHEETYASREFPDLVPMVRLFMATAQTILGEWHPPERACFGIAGPVINNTSKLTNLGWMLETEALQRELKIPLISLINDFAAVGYGVLCLQPDDIYTLRDGETNPDGAIAIIGAGTGLGQGYVIPYPGGYRVFATEGGHCDFAAQTELEVQLWRYLKEHYNLDRISTERVVSGLGIHAIYSFMRSRGICEESPDVAQAYQTWLKEAGKEEKTVDLAAVISQHAVAESDYLCTETMNLFVRAYGAETGNLALKLLPYGGVYLAGGIAAKNLPLLQRCGFVEAFNHKGRVSSAIERIPIHVILNPQVGLIGAALCAAQMV